jgi:hypothetical protein
LRLADYDYETVGIELLASKVVLRLSRDCPFDEIAPGYLALFVYHLAQLNPDVPVAFIPGYGHPIVATLPLELPLDAPVEAWTSAIEATLPRLEEALARQNDAADQFKRDDDFRWNSPLPDVEVTPEDLAEIGRLEAKLADAPPVKKPSSAPAPISPVTPRQTGTPSFDTTDPRSIKSMSTSEWIEAERQRQIRKWEAAKSR